MKERAFNREMNEMGFKAKDAKIDGKTAKCWIGICLKDSEIESEDEDSWENSWAEPVDQEINSYSLSNESKPECLKNSPDEFDF
jgi:hypothetical protein